MFSVKLNSGVPIYRQVIDQVNRQIDRGQLEVGAMLPSVRQLAHELGVNPMTVSRAYSQLESDGVVERKRGVGMVVVRKPIRPNGVLKPAIYQSLTWLFITRIGAGIAAAIVSYNTHLEVEPMIFANSLLQFGLLLDLL